MTHPSPSPPTKLIKHASEVISTNLCQIFNVCIAQGYYPVLMKIAQVIHMHKQGNKQQCSNFSPISLLSQFNNKKKYIYIFKRMYQYFENLISWILTNMVLGSSIRLLWQFTILLKPN